MYRIHTKLRTVEGVVLSRKNYHEADKVVTLFTKELGIIRAVAKGVRKIKSRRAPHLEVFTRCLVTLYEGSTLPSITEVSSLANYDAIRSDLSKVSYAYFYCELILLLLADGQEHADVYFLLVNALDALSSETGAVQSRIFVLELLWTLGFLPRSEHLSGTKLQAFVESVAERRMKTPAMVKFLS